MKINISTEINFDFKAVKKNKTKIFKEVAKVQKPKLAETLKKNIKDGKHEPIGDVTKSVRVINGRSGIKPLFDTQKLYNSIKETKAGVSANAYGGFQDKGFTLKKKYNKFGLDGFYAPKGKKRKVLYKVGGSTIKPRPWIFYNPTMEDLDTFMREFTKHLRTPMRKIRSQTLGK